MSKIDQKVNQPETTVAEAIWAEIKDKELNIFALPTQTVADYCVPVPIEPSKCYLQIKASAVLPAMEEVLGKKFVFEAVDKYVVVSRSLKV